MVPDSSRERDKLGILQLVDNTTKEQLPFSQTFTSLHLTSVCEFSTLFYTFAMELTKRICLTINSFFRW